MASKRRKTVRLYTDVKRNLYWTLPYTDAQVRVPVPVLLTACIVAKSSRGVPFECVLANAIMEYASQNPEAFPHKVMHAFVIKSRIYLIDRYAPGGQPAHAIRYFHDYGGIAVKFDKISKRKFLEKFNGEGFTLSLRPPIKGGKKAPYNVVRHSGPAHRKTVVSRGALRRAIDAGLMPLTRAAA
jgi:hypothetical protein